MRDHNALQEQLRETIKDLEGKSIIPANMEPDRLQEAKRCTMAALDLLEHIIGRWLGEKPPHLHTQKLFLPIEGLKKVVDTLKDDTANHWNTAYVLRAIVNVLDDLADNQLKDARAKVQSAWEQIATED